MDDNKDVYILFMEKYKTLDVICQTKLKEFFIEYYNIFFFTLFLILNEKRCKLVEKKLNNDI
jgi:hypothetical protein